MTVFGTSVQPRPGEDWHAALRRLDEKLGPAPMLRVYSTSAGEPSAQYALARATGRKLAHSYKSGTTEQIRALVREARQGDILVYFHEPEDDFGLAMPLSRYHEGMQRLCAAVVAEEKDGVVTPAACLMAWTINPASKRTWRAYITPEVVDALITAGGALMWDCYPALNFDDSIGDPQQLYGACASVSATIGLQWGILETGIPRPAQMSEDFDWQCAGWWKRALDFAANPRADLSPALAMLLWNSQKPGKTDFRLDDMPYSAAVWRSRLVSSTVSLSEQLPALRRALDGVTDPAGAGDVAMLRRIFDLLDSA